MSEKLKFHFHFDISTFIEIVWTCIHVYSVDIITGGEDLLTCPGLHPLGWTGVPDLYQTHRDDRSSVPVEWTDGDWDMCRGTGGVKMGHQ